MSNNSILFFNTSKVEPEYIMDSMSIDKFLGTLRFWNIYVNDVLPIQIT